MLAPFDRRLIDAARDGLPLVRRPYDALGARLGVGGDRVRERLAALLREGTILRIGAVAEPCSLGFGAAAMSVWDVDDARVDEFGEKVAALDFVSQCRRRPRVRPDWPYNLVAMVHGRMRGDIERGVTQIACLLIEACRDYEVLYCRDGATGCRFPC